MSNSSTEIKETLTKAVISVVSTQRGKKSRGVKIATMQRDIPIIPVAPFSR